MTEQRPTVGSSDVAAILGLSPWSSPTQAWARLTGLGPRYSSGDTPATRRGRIMEAALLAEWSRLRGVPVQPGPPITKSPIVAPDGWRHARPDGVAEVDGELVDVEVKTTRTFGPTWGADGSGDVPVYYAAQVAWQLAVMDAGRAELIAMAMATDEIRVYRIARDRDLERDLGARVEAWMQAHVWAPDAPPPDGAMPPDLLATLHPAGAGAEWLAATDADRAAAAEYVRARTDRDAAIGRMDAARTRICHAIGGADGIEGVASWRPSKGRRRFDTAAFRKAHPDLAEEFTTVGKPGRTFRIKESTS